VSLAELVYVSRSTDTDRLTVGKILSAARRFNGPRDITGLLLFDGSYYLQRLEGHRQVISNLYYRIAGDQRHSEVTLLAAGALSERECPGWSMGYVDSGEAVKDAVRRHSSSSSFDPYGMTSDSVLALTRYIARKPGVVLTTDPV
jgi:Sensors of blue-light using FAD